METKALCESRNVLFRLISELERLSVPPLASFSTGMVVEARWPHGLNAIFPDWVKALDMNIVLCS